MNREFVSLAKVFLQHFSATTSSVAKAVLQLADRSHIKGILLVISLGLFLSLSGCNYHLDASLEEINKTIIPSSSQNNSKSPGVFVGEVVTTSHGAVINGAFGESSEKVVLSNNVVIEGAFYE